MKIIREDVSINIHDDFLNMLTPIFSFDNTFIRFPIFRTYFK